MAISDIKRIDNPTLIAKHGLDSSAPANIAMLREVIEEANTDIAAATASAAAALATAIGDDVTPIVRTNNPTLADNDVNENIEALDAAVGVTPTSTEFISNSASVNANLSTLDADAQTKNEELGLGTFANATITAAVGELAIYSRIAGTDGNSLTVQLVDTGGTAGTLTWVYPDLLVEIDDGVTTDDEVRDYVMANMTLNRIFEFVSSGLGAMDVMVAAESLSGAVISTAFPIDEFSTFINTASFTALNREPNLYNGLQIMDAAVHTLNQRDNHTVSTEHIIKHKLLALGTYDFDTHGTALTAIDITSVDVLPDNAIITNVYFDVTTGFTSTSTTTTIAFQIEQGGGTVITTAATLAAIGVFEEGTISFPIKLTEASKLQVIQTVADVTAGVATVYVEYIVGL